MLQIFQPDECCGRPLAEALRSGALNDVKVWECPKCSQEWKPRYLPAEDVFLWEPQIYFARIDSEATLP